ncbi:molybdopterin-dependent oxidoreductase [Nocardioides sp. CFH 31398]|uniref:molybdopterin-dependent oxidoreductase n=1 Tax=Nocardioides sp. CFH 31398 TaxID=2919579 RepID=UPI001F05CA34|nr:molybdopterin-dependent oxidoreductase [Nocardioides sp. CFH 31398]MCH1865054.1 molybdopterin-dependent oxidoreductase [Nocardioides sp. CFH 31398]
MPVTRGFTGRRRPVSREGRLPPGQHDVGDGWPVLTAEAEPHLRDDQVSLTVGGLVTSTTTWSLADLQALPHSTYAGDIHCVTSWSKLGTRFTGVSLDLLLEAAGPLERAAYVVAESVTGYTTNLPLEHVTGGRAWVVWDHEGRPLPPEHGGPLRLLVPHLYFWKSAKWVSRIELTEVDRPGFWERYGYHDLGDPWTEQRYVGDA